MKGRNSVLSWYNGATYDVIGKVYSISGGGRDTEPVQDDDLLDGGVFRQVEPGSQFFEELTVAVQYDPADASAQNHQKLRAAYAAQTESFVKVKYSDAAGSGEIWHAFVKMIGNEEILPNNHVRRRIVFTPTGKGFVSEEDIDNASNPVV